MLPALVYGEQFFIFRGNYWDSSNYLSSAILFSNFQYSEVINKSFPSIFLEFQSIEYIIKARPMVNFLLSIFLNNYFSIFFSFYLFKIIITILIFISLLTFVEDNFDLKNISALLISFAFVISFWNIYIFEIDALSHYSSIPILILTIQYLFKVFNNLYNKENYLILVVLTSSLFIIYPEILIIVFSILLILLIDNIRSFNKKIIKLFLLSFLVFIFFTATSYETNYKHLIDSQLNQAVRANDWWGYFGSFIIGKDSLVLDTQFVSNLKLMISSNDSSKNIIKFIHTEHFNNNFKFIYLNIIPSLSGLYFLTIDKLVKNYLFIFQIFFLIFLIIYILKICYINIVYLLSNKFSKKKFLYFLSINIFLLLFFFNHSSFWSIIKLYTYLFPLLFLFFAINLQKKKVNYLYVFLISTFCLYKFSDFNNGIGRHDSFPSIINPMIKKEIIWTDKSYKNLQYCSNSSIIKNNYIIKAYLNLKIIDLGINKVKNQNCNVYLDNKKFKVIHE
ncbi:hypothetical protein N9T21_00595 [Candidatus Pelagibacter sp.]|nr:hypothetical protein [Candidatus Pelagibacter sp.]